MRPSTPTTTCPPEAAPWLWSLSSAWARGAVFRVAVSGPWTRRVRTAYLPSLSPGTRPPDFDEHPAAIAASLEGPGHARALSATTRTSHAPAEARLEDVSARTLVVMGERDPDFPDPAAEARHVADRLDGTVVMVPDAGHYPQAGRPEIVGPALLAFLAAA